MAWVDYKNAYDMVPQSWIIFTMEMVKQSMNRWKISLYAD